MRISTVQKRIHWAALLLGIAFIAGGVLYQAALPFILVLDELEFTSDQISAFEAASGRTHEIIVMDTSEFVATNVSPDAYAREVQQKIADAARESGLTLRRLDPREVETLETNIKRTSVDLELSGDLQHWVNMVEKLGTVRPAIFVERVDIKAGAGSRPDLNLNVRLQISSYSIDDSRKDVL
ncbi:MAG: GspMb/PilO family protein [Pseudomonadota bacterium]